MPSFLDNVALTAALKSAESLGPAAGLIALSPLLGLGTSTEVRAAAHLKSFECAWSLSRISVLQSLCDSWSSVPQGNEDDTYFSKVLKYCDIFRQDHLDLAYAFAEAELARNHSPRCQYLLARMCEDQSKAANLFSQAASSSGHKVLIASCHARLHLMTGSSFTMSELPLLGIPLRLQIITSALRSTSAYRRMSALSELADLNKRLESDQRRQLQAIAVGYIGSLESHKINPEEAHHLRSILTGLPDSDRHKTLNHLSMLEELSPTRYDDVMRSAWKEAPEVFQRSKATLSSGTAGPRPKTAVAHWLALTIINLKSRSPLSHLTELTHFIEGGESITPAMWTAAHILLRTPLRLKAAPLLTALLKSDSRPPFQWRHLASNEALGDSTRESLYARAVSAREPGSKDQYVVFAEAQSRAHLRAGNTDLALAALQKAKKLLQ